MPACVLRQETAATLDDHLAGRLLLLTDGSVLKDGWAAAACVVPSLELHNQSRSVCEASSTAAELAALDLATDVLLDFEFRRLLSSRTLVPRCNCLRGMPEVHHSPNAAAHATVVKRVLNALIEFFEASALYECL
ncbi:hypothetical protein MTO96_037115 [Rhipicephalus appendiculatus]